MEKNAKLNYKKIIIFLASVFLLGIIIFVSIFAFYKFIESKRISDCKSRGGIWGNYFSYVVPNSKGSCNLPTSDGDKICEDSRDCQSFCLTNRSTEADSVGSGTCYGWTIMPPCYNQVVNNVSSGEVCT
jgi:hypothetical protein